MTRRSGQHGSVVVMVLILMTVIVTVTAAFLVYLTRGRRSIAMVADQERGLALAEAGIEKGIRELSRPGRTYAGERGTAFGEGAFDVRAERVPGQRETWDLTADGILADQVDSPGMRFRTMPQVKARIKFERFADGRPGFIRTVRWEVLAPGH